MEHLRKLLGKRLFLFAVKLSSRSQCKRGNRVR